VAARTASIALVTCSGVCGVETYPELPADDRVRLSPYDPATGRHLGQREFVSDTDPAVLKVLPRSSPGAEVYD
jgi:hypothetical protein